MKVARSIAVAAGIAAIGGVIYLSNGASEPGTSTPVAFPDGEPTLAEQESPTILGADSSSHESQPEDYTLPSFADVNGVLSTWGELVEFRWVADCHDGFAMTTNGDAMPTTNCDNERLETDHPYGSYTIAQLEQAAEIGDAIATYILAMRLSKEQRYGRRDEASKLFAEAFRQTREPEIFRALLVDLDVVAATYRDGELIVDEFENVYILNKAGFELGVVDSDTFAAIERAKVDATGLDFEALDLEVEYLIAYLGGVQ